jgi:pimeloyl-ACP methyl ester carboxylesterase
MSNEKTFVLVHGAWHGGWCWRRVADRLRGYGHRVYTPTLTGLAERAHLMSTAITLDTHVRDIVDLFKYEEIADACLVGHSYGGVPVSAALEELRGKVSSAVFLDAFVPEDGEASIDLILPHMRDAIRAAIASGEVARPSPPAAYFKVQSLEDQAWIDSLTTPHPNGVWGVPVRNTGGREAVARKFYMRAGLYPNANFDTMMARQQAKPGWTCLTLAGGHDVMVDAPELLTQALLDAAGA